MLNVMLVVARADAKRVLAFHILQSTVYSWQINSTEPEVLSHK